jgi:hypothetical protein
MMVLQLVGNREMEINLNKQIKLIDKLYKLMLNYFIINVFRFLTKLYMLVSIHIIPFNEP